MEEVKRIIIVDDDLAILDAAQIMLERSGYRIDIFDSGEPVLNKSFERPHLFILDKQLPGTDGLELCKFLKADEDTRDIPVLILSASPKIGSLAKEVCADDFLEKPFRMKDLREKVDRLINGIHS